MKAVFFVVAVVLVASALAGSSRGHHDAAARTRDAAKKAEKEAARHPSPRVTVKPRKAGPALPVFPSTYTATATVTMPYADITEPITYYYDAPNGVMREDYYGGLNSYIYQVATNMTYQVMPMGTNVTGCLYIPGAVTLSSVFPDLTPFALTSSNVACPGDIFAGQQCNAWQYVQQIEQKTNTYTFWATAASGAPVRYEMMGYDSLFGSHYDQYLVDYASVDTSPIDSSVFAKPSNIPCTPFPGTPGEAAMGKLDINFAPHKQNTDAPVEDAFNSFMKKHNKQYESDVHRDARKNIFRNNLRYINSVNRQGLGYKLAINHMADMSGEERAARLGTRAPPKQGNGATGVHVHSGKALPASVDWRGTGAVSAVKDQGVCGSCWSFGSHETIEGAHFMKTGQAVRLSAQSLVDCTWASGNTGCDGGNDFLAYQWLLKYNGGNIPTETSYPYLMANGECHVDRAQTGATITGYVNVTSGDQSALMDALANLGPVSISIDASHDSLSFYSSGVYSDPQCQNGVADLDHTVLAVGYGTTQSGQDYWIVKNSWSTHWGNDGYVYIARANNMCGVATAPTYVTM